MTAARLNLEGFKVDVVPHGVKEDAVLFTDRVHELNSLPGEPFPEFLSRGDLVRMPVDASEEDTPGTFALQLELEIDRLSDVYLINVEEEFKHDWLKREYESTGSRVGIDMGIAPRGNQETAAGPGQSIDRAATVWKRKHPAVGNIISAGGVTKHPYAVVVVPRLK